MTTLPAEPAPPAAAGAIEGLIAGAGSRRHAIEGKLHFPSGVGGSTMLGLEAYRAI